MLRIFGSVLLLSSFGCGGKTGDTGDESGCSFSFSDTDTDTDTDTDDTADTGDSGYDGSSQRAADRGWRFQVSEFVEQMEQQEN